jgi:ketosteroid isomerase-like protein
LASSLLGLAGLNMVLMAFVPVLTVPTAIYMGRRAFNDDRTRRKAMRNAEMKRLASRYLDEVTFVVQKDSRDTIRKTHRQIRDHFLGRLEQLERTLQQAIAAAQSAQAAHAAGAAPRPIDDEGNEATVRHLASTADRLVAVGATAS